MKLFGTAQPFIESQETSFKIGRLVANYSFFKALFKYSDFDEFHIFCPTYANCQLTEKRISQVDIGRDCREKIKVFHIASLKKSIARNDYHVFHVGGWGFFFPGLIYLRNNYSARPFPITGVIHSLNAKETAFHALKVCAATTMPFDSIVCTSNCGKEAMKRLFQATESNFAPMNVKYTGRMDVIPLGIDDAYRTVPQTGQSRKVLGIDDDSFVILLLGRLSTDKKMDFGPFLGAIRRFAQKNNDKKIVLIIAGGADHNEQQVIKELISENHLESITRLFINFDDDLKPVLYSAADVYTAPIDNLQETFGLCVVEAMAHECAVVVSDFNGYSEIVDDGVTGVKIPTFWGNTMEDFENVSEIMNFSTYQLLLGQSIAVDMNKMCEALQELLDNHEKHVSLGRAAREKVKKYYFWSDIIKRYCDLWQQLSNEAQNSSVTPEKSKNPWEIDYWSVFSHYPSKIISPHNSVVLSEYGGEVLETGNIPIAYSDISASIIIPQLITIALRVIQQSSVTAQEVMISLQKHANISYSAALYYLLWMTKYNLINICE